MRWSCSWGNEEVQPSIRAVRLTAYWPRPKLARVEDCATQTAAKGFGRVDFALLSVVLVCFRSSC